MNKVYNLLKSIIFRTIPIWIIYKLLYLKRYYNGLLNCENTLAIDPNVQHYFVLGLPNSGNLGDQAIAISQLQYLQGISNNRNCQIYCIYLSQFIDHLRWIKKHCAKNDIIFFQGGGNIGDEYARAEFARQICVHEFKDNRIIVFPQTCYFTETFRGKTVLHNSQKLYSKHKDLIICAREKTSYDIMNKLFPNTEILLVPDIVYTYKCDSIIASDKEKKVLFCLRHDFESSLSKNSIETMMALCEDKGYTVEVTDTVIDRNDCYDLGEATTFVNNKIRELNTAEIVVTDRLHGMVLTALSSTKCIAISNYNHKVKGVYEWIANNQGVMFLSNTDDFERTFDLIVQGDCKIDFSELKAKFEQLDVAVGYEPRI